MRKISLIVAALSAVVILSGCGHNAIQYGDGVGFDIGINPENCMLSMNLRYGKILSAVIRDNVELELTGNVAADGLLLFSIPGFRSLPSVYTPGSHGMIVGLQNTVLRRYLHK